MRRPPHQARCRPVQQPGGAEDGPEIGDLRPLSAAVVDVHDGHLRRVAAVLAEAAEARRVQDARARRAAETRRAASSGSAHPAPSYPAKARRAACH